MDSPRKRKILIPKRSYDQSSSQTKTDLIINENTHGTYSKRLKTSELTSTTNTPSLPQSNKSSSNISTLPQSNKNFAISSASPIYSVNDSSSLQSKKRPSFNERLKRIRDSSETKEIPRKPNDDKSAVERAFDNKFNFMTSKHQNVLPAHDFSFQDRLTMKKFQNLQHTTANKLQCTPAIKNDTNKSNLLISDKSKSFGTDKNTQYNSSLLHTRLNIQNKSSTITSSSINQVQNTSFNIFKDGSTCDNIQKSIINSSSTLEFGQDTSVYSNNEFDQEESMDWAPIDQDELIEDIKKARLVLSQQQTHNESVNWFNESVISINPVTEKNTVNCKNIFIVVDTNVFIDKLQTITSVLNITYQDGSFPVIYVPWMVIQELDYFKDGYSLSTRHPVSNQIQERCRKAIKFINQALLSRKSNFKGQSVRDASDNLINSSNPDDAILSCCFQVTKTDNVILLSSDVNLRNKAIINNIQSESPGSIVRILLDKKNVMKKVNLKDSINNKMSLICSFILFSELKQFLGPELYELKKFPEPPWSYTLCVKYMNNYYDSILRNHVQKQCFKIIKDLCTTLESSEYDDQVLMELSLSLLVFLKVGLSKYNKNIQKVINEMKALDV